MTRAIESTIPVIAGLLFAAHPVHVEGVAYIVGRADTLCAVGMLSAMVLMLALLLLLRWGLAPLRRLGLELHNIEAGQQLQIQGSYPEELRPLALDLNAMMKQVQQLQSEMAEAQEKLGKAPSETDVLRLQVALEKGLTLTQSKRLIGDTEEDLKKDADELLESFGGSGEEPDDQGDPARRHPRRPRTGGDPDPDAGQPLDITKALESIPRIGGI